MGVGLELGSGLWTDLIRMGLRWNFREILVLS